MDAGLPQRADALPVDELVAHAAVLARVALVGARGAPLVGWAIWAWFKSRMLQFTLITQLSHAPRVADASAVLGATIGRVARAGAVLRAVRSVFVVGARRHLGQRAVRAVEAGGTGAGASRLIAGAAVLAGAREGAVAAILVRGAALRAAETIVHFQN